MLSLMLLFCHPEIYSTLKLDLSCVGKDFTRVMWASWWLANVSFPALGNTLRFDWLHSYYVTLSGFLMTSIGFIFMAAVMNIFDLFAGSKVLISGESSVKES